MYVGIAVGNNESSNNNKKRMPRSVSSCSCMFRSALAEVVLSLKPEVDFSCLLCRCIQYGSVCWYLGEKNGKLFISDNCYIAVAR
jgi:hypothetical protein